MALKKPIVLLHESDARYGGFDFCAAHEGAPTDLQELLDNNESLPFRRRGYERDGMLRTVIERAGFKELLESVRTGTGTAAEVLATVPQAICHFALDTLYKRPVQDELVHVLLLAKQEGRPISCVLLHGMGGTGKTVTAVAAIQEKTVRAHYGGGGMYWITVGADALGARIQALQAMLYKQLTGKSITDEGQDEHQRQAMLVTAMGEKERALVVLDDPWMPEQVRFLNPIDSSSTDHRLLITTRIRDLVPKATRVELPLMGKEEAVALLLDLANIEEADYLKEEPGSEWPPQAVSCRECIMTTV